jgi:hypothetical protein
MRRQPKVLPREAGWSDWVVGGGKLLLLVGFISHLLILEICFARDVIGIAQRTTLLWPNSFLLSPLAVPS